MELSNAAAFSLAIGAVEDRKIARTWRDNMRYYPRNSPGWKQCLYMARKYTRFAVAAEAAVRAYADALILQAARDDLEDLPF